MACNNYLKNNTLLYVVYLLLDSLLRQTSLVNVIALTRPYSPQRTRYQELQYSHPFLVKYWFALERYLALRKHAARLWPLGNFSERRKSFVFNKSTKIAAISLHNCPMDKDNAIIVFARHPTPGQVKTRLAAGVGNDGAARFYKNCAEKVIQECLG